MTHNQRVEKHIDLAEFSDARLNGRGGRRWILHVEPRDQNVVPLQKGNLKQIPRRIDPV